MKKLLNLLLLAVCPFAVNAQETVSTEAYDFESWTQDWRDPLTEAFIIADACKLRSQPSSGSEMVAKLLIGDRVKVLAVSGTDTTINGIQSRWIHVEAGKKKGYVWGGLLTNQVLKVSDTTSAIWGITRIVREGDTLVDYYASVRIFSHRQIIKQTEFKVSHADQPGYGELVLIRNPLLEGVKHVFVYNTLAEACGVSWSEHYLLETEEKISYLESGSGVSEAGAFHSSAVLIFPTLEKEEDYTIPYTRKPEKDQILRVTSLDEYDENCVWQEHTSIESFEWKEGRMNPFCRD
ncbi:SH3 domain-containing protein [Fluviicola sp.]|jgi:hypothetical protein|uniref:SH3 domain-containing protein n=1 Tax=Fluviicola sp. TaxID=1917219 RepID=UPI00282C69DC|nr:SH3 domain-containing protein [Fluviicola sp.]MDR0802906.1 SH3 domain-containing protein [Fluviicola sp.]